MQISKFAVFSMLNTFLLFLLILSSCKKVLLFGIFILANLRIVNSPPLSAPVLLFFECPCNFQQPDLLVHNFLKLLIILV